MKFIYSLVILLVAHTSRAGKVDTVVIYSNSMAREIKAVVIRPDSYKKKKDRFPVLYLLHGYDGRYDNWIRRVPELMAYADTYGILIVCPDGGYSSWYFDSPVDSSMRYETYIAKEVVGYVDTHYRTVADKNHRAITGLSMGGHGALFLAFRHPDIFGATGSMSGVLDLNERKNSYDIAKRIGDTARYQQNWRDWSIINLVKQHTATTLKITFDCGIKDAFINANRRLHTQMLELRIPHQYTEAPGTHGWEYWRAALPYQLLFFHRFFSGKLP